MSDLDDLHAAMPEQPDEQTQVALDEASAWVGSDGVEAVGLGETDDGSPCVVVYAGEGATAVPETAGGLPVRVERTGPFQAYDDAGPVAPVGGEPGPEA